MAAKPIRTDHIRVDGKLLQGPSVSLTSRLTSRKVRDHGERREEAPTVMDLVQKVKGRVYPVDVSMASEGLILMTNDGALANALMKASSNVPKTMW